MNELVLGEEALARRPDLALLVFQYVATWSRVDADTELMLHSCLNADHAVLTAILDGITSSEARRAGVENAIEQSLGSASRAAFQAIRKEATGCRRQRHKFAHHIWGHSQEEPDVLLLCDPALMGRHLTATRRRTQSFGAADGSGAVYLAFGGHNPKTVDWRQVAAQFDKYDQSELQKHLTKVIRVHRLLTQLRRALFDDAEGQALRSVLDAELGLSLNP